MSPMTFCGSGRAFSECMEKNIGAKIHSMIETNSLNDTNLRIFFMVGNLRCVATTYN